MNHQGKKTDSYTFFEEDSEESFEGFAVDVVPRNAEFRAVINMEQSAKDPLIQDDLESGWCMVDTDPENAPLTGTPGLIAIYVFPLSWGRH
jgi:hypothetical protein